MLRNDPRLYYYPEKGYVTVYRDNGTLEIIHQLTLYNNLRDLQTNDVIDVDDDQFYLGRLSL
jgi:hypothetical protein